MKKQDFLDAIHNNYVNGEELIRIKNGDYSTVDNAFKNFELSSFISGVQVAKGMMVRIADKISRLENLTVKEPEVVDESVEDTIIDMINYLNILLTYLQFKGKV